MKKIMIPLFAMMFAGIAVGPTSCISGDENDDNDSNIINVGDTAPSFTLADNGNTGVEFVSPGDFEGKTSLLVFFNTGCGDCKREMPKVFAVWQDVKGEPGVQVITIAREESATDVSTYWQNNGYGEMPWYSDPDRSVFSKFATQSVPRLYIIGPDAQVKRMWVEYLWDYDGKQLTADQLTDVFRQYVDAAQ